MAQTPPLITPVTKATMSAVTFQSLATDDHKYAADPIPIGVKIPAIVKRAIGDLNKSITSRNIILNPACKDLSFSA